MAPTSSKLLQEKNVWTIAVTGGPCAGKSTAMNFLKVFFGKLGYIVFTPQETATHLFAMGIEASHFNSDRAYLFNRNVLRNILANEQCALDLATTYKDQKVIIFCDRGAMDVAAYCSEEEWSNILKDLYLVEADLQSRYDHVVHLVTAAVGAEDMYTTANNTARSETAEQAKELDKKTMKAWEGHTAVSVIGNKGTTCIADKMNNMIQELCDRIGIPLEEQISSRSKKRKWMVESFDFEALQVYPEYEVEHFYLASTDPDIQMRVRRRSRNGHSLYWLTTRKYNRETNDSSEIRRLLRKEEYITLTSLKDPARASIFKRRRCFHHENLYFKLDMFSDPLQPQGNGNQFVFLETYTTVPKDTPHPDGAMPPFLKIQKEITDDPTFSMHTLSLHGTHDTGSTFANDSFPEQAAFDTVTHTANDTD